MIIIMNWVGSRSQEVLTHIKGHMHQCKNHTSQYIPFGRKRSPHVSNPPNQLINLSRRRFNRLSLCHNMVKHAMGIHNKEMPSTTPLDMSEGTMTRLCV